MNYHFICIETLILMKLSSLNLAFRLIINFSFVLRWTMSIDSSCGAHLLFI